MLSASASNELAVKRGKKNDSANNVRQENAKRHMPFEIPSMVKSAVQMLILFPTHHHYLGSFLLRKSSKWALKMS